MKKFLVLAPALLLLAVSCQPKSATNTTAFTYKGPDACKLLTAADVKSTLGIDVAAGASEPSYINGSSCKFKGSDGSSSVLLQIGASSYYSDKLFPQAKPTDFGDKGFYQEPTSGNANIQVIQGDRMVYITVYSASPYTADQLKAATKLVVDKL